MSETDLDFVAFALQEGVDAFGVSFAETAEDILKVKRFVQAKGQSAYVVTKIERAEAIGNFDGILSAKDESLIWVEDESSDDRREVLSMKIIKA